MIASVAAEVQRDPTGVIVMALVFAGLLYLSATAGRPGATRSRLDGVMWLAAIVIGLVVWAEYSGAELW